MRFINVVLSSLAALPTFAIAADVAGPTKVDAPAAVYTPGGIDSSIEQPPEPPTSKDSVANTTSNVTKPSVPAVLPNPRAQNVAIGATSPKAVSIDKAPQSLSNTVVTGGDEDIGATPAQRPATRPTMPVPSTPIVPIPPVTAPVPTTHTTAAEVAKTAEPVPAIPSTNYVEVAPMPGRSPFLSAATERSRGDHPVMCWNQTPLVIAIEDIAKTYNVNIQSSGIQGLSISGDFRTIPLEKVLAAIVGSAPDKLAWTKSGETYYIGPRLNVSTERTVNVNLNVVRVFDIPMNARESFLDEFSKVRLPDSSLIPISNPRTSTASFRVVATEDVMKKLQGSLASLTVKPVSIPVVSEQSKKESAEIVRERIRLLEKRQQIQEKLNAAPSI